MNYFLGVFSLFILRTRSSVDALEIQVVNPYWFFEGKNITFACMARNPQNLYSIEWTLQMGNDYIKLQNSSNGVILIANSQSGSKIKSTIILKNSSKYTSEGRAFIKCEFYNNGDVDDSRYLEFRVINDKDMPNVTVDTGKTKVERGDSVTLLCNTRGKVGIWKMGITWSKNGKVLKSFQQKSPGEVTDLSYYIAKANGSVGGVYTCRASVTAEKRKFQDSDTVSLSVIPKLIGQKSKSLYPKGETVKVHCDIDGYPLNIIWQKQSSDGIDQVVSDGSRFKIAENGRTLTISNFQSDDAATFYCKDNDGYGNEIVQTFKLIKKVDPHIKNDSKIRKKIFIPGRSLILECEVSALPSCVSWNTYNPHNGEKQNVTDIPGIFPPTLCNKTLWFTNNSDVANGQKFSCADGAVMQTFTITKMIKPRLTGPSNKEVKVEEGDDVTLQCDIEVNPLVVTWMVHGRLLNASVDSKFVINNDDPRVLRILDVNYDDRGAMYCSAKNVLDKKGVGQKITLRVKDPLEILWPVIGILIVIVLVALFIGIGMYRKRRRGPDPDKHAKEISRSQADGSHGQEKSLLKNEGALS